MEILLKRAKSRNYHNEKLILISRIMKFCNVIERKIVAKGGARGINISWTMINFAIDEIEVYERDKDQDGQRGP